MLDRFLKPLRQLKQVRILFLLLVLNILAWGSNYLSVLALIHWTSPNYFEATLLLLLFMNLGLLIPSSPGALGVMQVAFWMALAPFGVIREDALALSFAYQGGLYLFTLGIGFPYFFRANLNWNKIKNLEDKADTLCAASVD